MAARDPQTGKFPKGNGAGQGGPAKGEGWGGPARGASTKRIKAGDPDGIQALSNDAAVKAHQVERAEALTDHLFALAMNADRQETQLAATIACLDRIEGKPVQRQDVTSQGGRVGYVIAAPDEAESAEAWEARYRADPEGAH